MGLTFAIAVIALTLVWVTILMPRAFRQDQADLKKRREEKGYPDDRAAIVKAIYGALSRLASNVMAIQKNQQEDITAYSLDTRARLYMIASDLARLNGQLRLLGVFVPREYEYALEHLLYQALAKPQDYIEDKPTADIKITRGNTLLRLAAFVEGLQK